MLLWQPKFTMLKFLIISMAILTSTNSAAALLNLSDSPPFLGGNVAPNVFFLIDDSGSMDYEILTTRHWHFCAYDPLADGTKKSTDCGWEETGNLFRGYGGNGYRYFEYLYQNADNQYNTDCNGTSNNDVASCPEAGTKDWRLYNTDTNVIYYNPGVTYKPWITGDCLLDGTKCFDADFTNARSNAAESTPGYTALRDLAGIDYHVWIDDKGFDGDRPKRGSNLNITNEPNGIVDLWDSHVKIVLNSNDISVYSVTYSPDADSMNETTTLQATLTDNSACYNVLGSDALVRRVFNGELGYTSTNASGCRSIAQAKTNVANWYQYNRRRGLMAKGAVTTVINEFPDFRYGLTVLNKFSQLFVEMPSNGDDFATHNQGLISQLFQFQWPPQGTPLRRGLERAGKYYDDALPQLPSPIIEACQQNFTVLLSDTLWNGQAPASVAHDEDGDGYKGTFADVARYYYNKDLSALTNAVPANPWDPATHQHMVTFAVTFGAKGNLTDTDDDGQPNPSLNVSSDWGDPFSDEGAKIDDIWHGAFNSTGTYASAQTPQEITDSLVKALQNITERVSSAATVAQNSTTLRTDSQVYQARFHSKSWRGELLAYNIDMTGKIASTPAWNADCVLTGGECSIPAIGANNNPGINPTDRVIITPAFDGSNTAIPFRWPSSYENTKVNGSVPDNIASLLQYAPYDANTSVTAEIAANQRYGEKLVNYLRGDRTEEVQNNGVYGFRNRSSVLGDIVHSDPLYVGSPLRYYADDFESQSYSTFKTTYANRTPMVYTGANDGMLHGFSAIDGSEKLAYVPRMREVYENLPTLSNLTYVHKYFVDGAPTEADVFINNNWKTILVSALRKGGQGLFALDITDPSNFSEDNADQIFLWEFTDENDPDVGYIYGKPLIAKVKTSSTTSKWAVIFGNGYNNSKADGFASSSGKAALFIVFIENGLDGTWTLSQDYIKIPVGTGTVDTPSGLGGIYVVDTDKDFIADYVYAGDLQGNLWKFDLTDPDPTTWANNTTLFFQASYLVAGDQPITGTPIVGPHPNGLSNGIMVYFGTGKYLEDQDNQSTGFATQAFYALWDKLDGTKPLKSNLLQQYILAEVNQNIDTNGDGAADSVVSLRQVSNYSINWAEPVNAGDPAQHLGWYINLQPQGSSTNNGERQVARPLLRNKNVIFTTLAPSQTACDFGGDSWIMEVNQNNGGATSVPVFDLNKDRAFDTADYMQLPSSSYVQQSDGTLVLTQTDYSNSSTSTSIASGLKSTVGITPTPAVFAGPDVGSEVKVLSGSTGLDTVIENASMGPSGRQNWRQLY